MPTTTNETTSFLQGRRDIGRLVDGIGGGDTFAAAPIPRFDCGRGLEATLKSTVAASALLQAMCVQPGVGGRS